MNNGSLYLSTSAYHNDTLFSTRVIPAEVCYIPSFISCFMTFVAWILLRNYIAKYTSFFVVDISFSYCSVCSYITSNRHSKLHLQTVDDLLDFRRGGGANRDICILWLRMVMICLGRYNQCVKHSQHVKHALSRGPWGHAPQENFANLASVLRSNLVGILSENDIVYV